jgi:hypothetical protein
MYPGYEKEIAPNRMGSVFGLRISDALFSSIF